MKNENSYVAKPELWSDEQMGYYNKQLAQAIALCVEVAPEKVPGWQLNYVQSGVDLIALPAMTRDSLAYTGCYYLGFQVYTAMTQHWEQMGIKETPEKDFLYSKNGWDIRITHSEIIDLLNEYLFDTIVPDAFDFNSFIGGVNFWLVADCDTRAVLHEVVVKYASDKWARIMARQAAAAAAAPVVAPKRGLFDRLMNGWDK